MFFSRAFELAVIVDAKFSQARRTVATRQRFWLFLTSFWLLWWVLWLPVSLNYQWKGAQPLHDSSSNVRVWKGFKQLAINKFYADKNLVQLSFSHRKCTLKFFVRPYFQFQVFWVFKTGWNWAFHRSFVWTVVQPEAIKLIKNLSKRCQKLCRVATVRRAWL